MKMKSPLFGVILGLFAVVHSTPVDTVTQIPTKAEDVVLREAVADEFLVDPLFFPSLTTQPPKRNTTVQASRQTPSDTEESDTHTLSDDMIESNSAGETSDKSTNSVFFQDRDEHYATASPSSTSTVLPRDTDLSTSDSSSTRSPQSDFTSSSMPNVDHSFLNTLSSELGSGYGEILGQNPATSSSMTPSSDTETRPTSLLTENKGSGSGEFSSSSMTPSSDTETRPTSPFTENEGSGSGEFSSFSMTSSFNTETSTASSTFPATIISSEGSRSSSRSGLGSGSEVFSSSETRKELPRQGQLPVYSVKEPHIVEVFGNPDSPQHKGHTTPDWIIILGFVVGIAALVMLCAAIATRDKWNGPKKVKTRTNSSHQQRVVEMETFLHKDMPRENGKAAEYTVIPLDELPEKYSH